MRTATVKQLKDELQTRTPVELMQLTLRLSKFKKENKELLTYLLFAADDELQYIIEIKEEFDEAFEEVNNSSYYFMKKSLRKLLRRLKTYIRYSDSKETEVELLLYFCEKLKAFYPSIFQNRVLTNMYERQLGMLEKAIAKLHEDLQYEYQPRLASLTDFTRD